MSLNPIVRIKHFVRVLLQVSRIGFFIRPLVSLYIKLIASHYFDGNCIFKGSFYTRSWIPFVSDVDLNIIGRTFTENQKKIKKSFFRLNQKCRIDIMAKFFSPELDQLYYQAGLYYHHASPWINNKLIAKRRNLWLCLREIMNRYPEHARSKTNIIYLPQKKQKDRWMEFATDIGLEHLAKKITTEDSLNLWTRLSAKACEKIFWENYYLKFQIIEGMPKIDKYFEKGHVTNEDYQPLSSENLKFCPMNFNSAEELRNHYLKLANLTPFPTGHIDLYPFLPKIGLTSIKLESAIIPKLAMLQWTLETVVIFEDNPYLYTIDTASYKRLEDCIYTRLPLLCKMFKQIEMPLVHEKKLNDKIIQDHYMLAERLLRQAMQLNGLLP